MLLELDNEKYEHIEQWSECQEVELERIEEVEQILSDENKTSEEQEYLSFLKAGVPNSKRNAFFSAYYDYIIKNNIMSKNSE